MNVQNRKVGSDLADHFFKYYTSELCIIIKKLHLKTQNKQKALLGTVNKKKLVISKRKQ